MSEKRNSKNEHMSISDPGEKIQWGADREPRKNERVPSSAYTKTFLEILGVLGGACLPIVTLRLYDPEGQPGLNSPLEPPPVNTE
jgi:hypothetical protein